MGNRLRRASRRDETQTGEERASETESTNSPTQCLELPTKDSGVAIPEPHERISKGDNVDRLSSRQDHLDEGQQHSSVSSASRSHDSLAHKRTPEQNAFTESETAKAAGGVLAQTDLDDHGKEPCDLGLPKLSLDPQHTQTCIASEQGEQCLHDLSQPANASIPRPYQGEAIGESLCGANRDGSSTKRRSRKKSKDTIGNKVRQLYSM